jgi:ribonuclease BN (tRNA processing enzyme)
VTHLHGDHFGGLPFLILEFSHRTTPRTCDRGPGSVCSRPRLRD